MNPAHLNEFEAMTHQPANIRYTYFIKRVADSEEVWGLYDKGWATTYDQDGQLLIPFWSKQEFAQHYAREEWADSQATLIPLSVFMDEMLPQMKEDQCKPSIFWNGNDAAVPEIEALLTDLEYELKQY